MGCSGCECSWSEMGDMGYCRKSCKMLLHNLHDKYKEPAQCPWFLDMYVYSSSDLSTALNHVPVVNNPLLLKVMVFVDGVMRGA